jgi:hypothetical protein
MIGRTKLTKLSVTIQNNVTHTDILICWSEYRDEHSFGICAVSLKKFKDVSKVLTPSTSRVMTDLTHGPDDRGSKRL